MCQRDLRLAIPVPTPAALEALADGNIGAMNILMELATKRPEDMLAIVSNLDSKHLYGTNLYEVYVKVCGSDMDRFLYHLYMELPCQLCGEIGFTGPHLADMNEEEFSAHASARQFGKPGTYWALQDPPDNPDYEYPIVAGAAAPS